MINKPEVYIYNTQRFYVHGPEVLTQAALQGLMKNKPKFCTITCKGFNMHNPEVYIF